MAVLHPPCEKICVVMRRIAEVGYRARYPEMYFWMRWGVAPPSQVQRVKLGSNFDVMGWTDSCRRYLMLLNHRIRGARISVGGNFTGLSLCKSLMHLHFW